MMRLLTRLLLLYFSLAAMLLVFFPLAVSANGAEDIHIPGTVSGTGTYFTINDSEYFNITLESTAEVSLSLSSVPELITIYTDVSISTADTVFTLTGLAPFTVYHFYIDDYHNHEVVATDSNGFFSFTHALAAPHLIFVQPRASTKFIRDNATGGDCNSIGIWDVITKTCTLTRDVFETIQIDSNGITLSGTISPLISPPVLECIEEFKKKKIFSFEEAGQPRSIIEGHTSKCGKIKLMSAIKQKEILLYSITRLSCRYLSC